MIKKKIQSYLYSNNNYILPRPTTLTLLLIAFNFIFLFLLVEPAREFLMQLVFGRVNKLALLLPASIIGTIALYRFKWQEYKTLSWMLILYIIVQLINAGILFFAVGNLSLMQIIGVMISIIFMLTYAIGYRTGIIHPDFIIQKYFSWKTVTLSVLLILIGNIIISIFYPDKWYIYSFWGITLSSYISLFIEKTIKFKFSNDVKNLTDKIYYHANKMIRENKEEEFVKEDELFFILEKSELTHNGRGFGNLEINQDAVFVHISVNEKRQLLVFPIYENLYKETYVGNNPMLLK